MRFINYIFLMVLAFVVTACENDGKKQSAAKKEEVKKVVAPSFNEDSAFSFVKKQVEFGPRVPGSKAHANTAKFLENTLKAYGANVIIQSGKIKTYDGKSFDLKNIIASFQPKASKRILLAAHWDTRHIADQDSKDKGKPIDGANDGGSGVAVLLEVARQMSLKNPTLGVDIILFDLEDYGQPDDSNLPEMRDSYCLGSQYWAKNLHVPNYRPMYGVLLDMVGGENVFFTQEEVSRTFAPQVVEYVWQKAAQAGYSSNFSYEHTPAIIDDHYYINSIANIPTIDLIHRDASSVSGFWKHWHTHEDNIANIDKKSLKVTGQVLMQLVYTE
jgi:glutaminyl-peptide cyclotransferase